MKKIVSAVVALSVMNLVMPVELPPFHIAEALAEPVTMPTDPSSMTNETAVSSEVFGSMTAASEAAVEEMNTLAEMEGPVVSTAFVSLAVDGELNPLPPMPIWFE